MQPFKLIVESYKGFARHKASFLAASISYYAFLSLFPLLLFVISLLGFFLESGQIQEEVLSYVHRVLPVSGQLIESNLRAIIEKREGVGLLGLAGLLWTGTEVFSALEYALNTILSIPTPRHFLKHRLFAFLLVLAGALLVSISLIATSFVSPFKGLLLDLAPDAGSTIALLLPVVSVLVALATSIGIFFLTYSLVPNAYSAWRDLWLGAVAGGLVWEMAKYAFGWYLGSLARYDVLYGTLGAVIALLVWVYLSGSILLFGAELNLSYRTLRKGSSLLSSPRSSPEPS